MCSKHPLILMVSLSFKGQLNPIRRLARRLARLTGSNITIAIPLPTHRRLFPDSASSAGDLDDNANEPPLNPDGSGIISFAPYSDGFDNNGGYKPYDDPFDFYFSSLKSVGSQTVASIANRLIARGQPISCIVYSFVNVWVADIARDLGVPPIFLWTQPASILNIYYHFFQGHPSFSSRTIQLPALPSLSAEEVPFMLTKTSVFRVVLDEINTEIFERSQKKTKVLVNTFGELEAAVMEVLRDKVEMLAVGPLVGEEVEEEDKGCMKWLESQNERSVVYVAFGTVLTPTAQQLNEIEWGLKESGRPYLWVRKKKGEECLVDEGESMKGMVVKWCAQSRVMAHKSVGCFVTHCGWNSMMEAVMNGVPMVMMPEGLDQPTNAALAEKQWGVGVRPTLGKNGVTEAAELRRCIELVMGKGERGMIIQKQLKEWKKKAQEAILEDGVLSRNLTYFVEGLSS